MPDRSYTVDEIDALRFALEERFVWGSSLGPDTSKSSGFGRSYQRQDMIATVEAQLRTFMIAGITADDIYAEDRRRREKKTAALAKATPPRGRVRVAPPDRPPHAVGSRRRSTPPMTDLSLAEKVEGLTSEAPIDRLSRLMTRWRAKNEIRDRGTWLGISEIAGTMQMPKPVVRKMLADLRDAGQVEMWAASNGVFWRAAFLRAKGEQNGNA